jgi:hypothetical protein
VTFLARPFGAQRFGLTLNINSTQTTTYNILTQATATGLYVAGFTDILLNVNANVAVTSGNGIISGALTAGDSIALVNSAIICGGGGAFGFFTNFTSALSVTYQVNVGSDALSISVPILVNITNNGTMAAGGGAGAPSVCAYSTTVTGCMGCPGGYGLNYFGNGPGGTSPSHTPTGFSGTNSPPNLTSSQTGAIGYSAGSPAATVGAGGNGGNYATAGTAAGTAGQGPSVIPGSAISPGDYGYVANANGVATINFLVAGNRYGH